eukprot:1159854-Pelagomonas_calceolata.AAC.10
MEDVQKSPLELAEHIQYTQHKHVRAYAHTASYFTPLFLLDRRLVSSRAPLQQVGLTPSLSADASC